MTQPASRTRRRVEIGVAVGLLALVLAWSEGLLRRRVGPDQAESERGAAAAGATVAVEAREIPITVEGVGTVRAIEEAVISPRVPGTILELEVGAGDRVRRGQVLLRLAAPELAAQQEASSGAVRAAESALAQAERDFRRVATLREREAATRVEWERAETALSQARAELARARGTADAAASMAGYADVRAPFDGVILERLRDPGDLVGPGTPLVRLANDSRFRLEASLADRDAASLVPGQPLAVTIDSLGVTGDGRVAELVPAADPASRTSTVKIDLPSLEGLRSGLFGRAAVTTGSRRALVVPARAVRRTGGLDTVQRVGGDERRETRYVRIGERLPDGSVEILAGVDAGDRVAVP